jgi:hypothetical protein
VGRVFGHKHQVHRAPSAVLPQHVLPTAAATVVLAAASFVAAGLALVAVSRSPVLRRAAAVVAAVAAAVAAAVVVAATQHHHGTPSPSIVVPSSFQGVGKHVDFQGELEPFVQFDGLKGFVIQIKAF